MTQPTLTADKGEQLKAVFTYNTDLTGKTATFVARAKVGDPNPALVELVSGQTVTDGTITIDTTAKTVTVVVNGPKTATLPSSSVWAMWLNPGLDDASAVSGLLRINEVVQP